MPRKIDELDVEEVLEIYRLLHEIEDKLNRILEILEGKKK